ncbi:MAG TPA: hypothetical protein VK110_11310 [Salinisphaeraceae bacterium]|nr:hypothetical protein [Salinisphaeraceae bacterium]
MSFRLHMDNAFRYDAGIRGQLTRDCKRVVGKHNLQQPADYIDALAIAAADIRYHAKLFDCMAEYAERRQFERRAETCRTKREFLQRLKQRVRA